jgi:hypothetical protein
LLDERECSPEEFDAHERELPTLPGDRHFGARLRLEQLTDVDVEHIVGHAVTVAGVQRLLR